MKQMGGKSNLREHTPFILLLIILLTIIIAFSDPKIPLPPEINGTNVILVIDNSLSMDEMLNDKIKMDIVKDAAASLIEKVEPPSEIGIVVFGTYGEILLNPTSLNDVILDKLYSIEPTGGGTATATGISMAIALAKADPEQNGVIILLSDGVDNSGLSLDPIIELSSKHNIPIHTISLGQDALAGYAYDDEFLKTISEETGGLNVVTSDQGILRDIYARIATEVNKTPIETSVKDWFLASSLVLLLTSIYIIYGRYRILI